MTLAIEAPTDAQLGYIASLCREHGMPHPVVYLEAKRAFAEGETAYDPRLPDAD